MDGRLRRQRQPRRHRARTGIAGLPGRGGEGGCRARWRRRARRKTAQGEMSVDRGIGECRRGWRHDVGAGIEKHRRRQRDHEIEDRCPLRHARRSLLGVRITEIRLLAGRDHGFATRTACRHGRLSLKKRPRKPFAVIRLEHFEPAAAGGGKMSVSTHALELRPRRWTPQPSNPYAGCRIVAKDARQFRRSDGRCWENACLRAR